MRHANVQNNDSAILRLLAWYARCRFSGSGAKKSQKKLAQRDLNSRVLGTKDFESFPITTLAWTN
jgi:hypothetical protein